MTKKKIILPVSAEVPVELTKALPLPPNTTEQQDLVTERQSRINITWEFTQAVIAVLLVFTVCLCMVLKIEIRTEFWILVSIVVQSYFQRTNHTRIGGVGYKPEGETR